MRLPVYRTALGIGLWDIVRTSYNTGPFEVVNLTTPKHVETDTTHLSIRRLPTISLICGLPPGHRNYASMGGRGDFFLNSIRLQDGRWLTDNNDEVFVDKRADLPPCRIDMFDTYLQPDTPYVEQPGVDYDAGDAHIWHCAHCHRDCNTADRKRVVQCPTCGWSLVPIFVHRYPAIEAKPINDIERWLRY